MGAPEKYRRFYICLVLCVVADRWSRYRTGEKKLQTLTIKSQTYNKQILHQQYVSNPEDELDCAISFQKLHYLCHPEQC
eukprot:3186742-Ditylum_brightwellii.AAC.1